MQFSPYTPEAPTSDVLRYFLRFRIITYALVVLLSVSSVQPTKISILIISGCYVALVVVAYRWLLSTQTKTTIFMLVDIAVAFVFLTATGGYKSPFYFYSFSPLLVGAFLGDYAIAVCLAIAQPLLFAVSLHLNGHTIPNIQAIGDQPISNYFFYIATALSVAYLADAVEKLRRSKQARELAAEELNNAISNLLVRARMHGLSQREAEVLIHLADSKDTQQIAQLLELSPATVRTYMRRIYEKLGVASKHKALARILSTGEADG
ncbi:MAG TPA: LuxR C-terminal-related transcriptional regulator [Candidatus Aquicultor sp.]|jgi:DNA-binding CsgD family transcriptional regulator